MPVTKQGEALAAHLANKEWNEADALVHQIRNVHTLVKSGWEVVWKDPDVPYSLVRYLLVKIRALSNCLGKLYPVGLYSFMYQERRGELLSEASVSTIKAFFAALTGTYRSDGGMVVEWPKQESLQQEIDVLWRGYLDLPYKYETDGPVEGNAEHIAQVLSVHSLQDLERIPELHRLWQSTEILLKAAKGIDLDRLDWGVLHAIAELDCLTIVMWFAVRLYPNQVCARDSNGKTPLHIAATKSIHAQQVTRAATRGSAFGSRYQYHHFRTSYPEELQEAEDFMAAFLAKHSPEAAAVCDSQRRVPLLTSILSLPSQLEQPKEHSHTVSHPQLSHRLKRLIEAAPLALASRDFTTHLYPFQIAASVDAPLDTVYTLLRGDPSTFKYRKITKREADYERLLKENESLKRQLKDKDDMLQQLQSKLGYYEKQQENDDGGQGERKRARLSS